MKFSVHSILIIALSILYCCSSYANKSDDIKSATKRNDKISSKWVDRATIKSGSKISSDQGVLWYQQPASVWEEALPIGNGQLGAMIFGGVADERIQINESSLWEGSPLDRVDTSALEKLPEIRKLIFEGKNKEAVEIASKHMLGKPARIRPFQTLGEIWFDTPEIEVSDYIRDLNLSTAVTSIKYTANNTEYLREAFVSAIDNVLVINFKAKGKGKINFSLKMGRESGALCFPSSHDKNSLILRGDAVGYEKEGGEKGLSFAAQVKAYTKSGVIELSDNTLHILNASEVTILVSAATNYPGLGKGAADPSIDILDICSKTLAKAEKKTFEQLKHDHIKDYQQYYNRVSLNLKNSDIQASTLPTDKRIKLAKQKGYPDNGLISTYFQFGRYLLISSSRPGTLPANLQGLWAWQMKPLWNSDYHTNINLQMNYWPAEITNLSEMHMPLFDLSESLVNPGSKTAKAIYGARGWVVHHLTDIWGFTTPADGPQGIWPMGAAWLARHPWEHYEYTGDEKFLKDRGYPLMRGAAEFILDFLVEAPAGTICEGKLVTNPSYSPENTYILPDGSKSMFTYGATMDMQIIHELLTNCISSCELLDCDKEFKVRYQEALERLAPVQISKKTGRIMEWAEDYEEAEPHHRHTSHLYGLHPSNQITTIATPELAEAARKTLNGRGDGGTGWGLAWKINMWNRLQDGNRAYTLLSNLLNTKTYPNLFDAHPPFQIDGNFGATAAIAEMLLQSQTQSNDGTYIIQLLPALPDALVDGEVKGLCAKGAFEINIKWENKKIVEVQVLSRKGRKLHITDGLNTYSKDTNVGEVIHLNNKLQRVE